MPIRAELLTVCTVADRPATDGVLRIAVAGDIDAATVPALRTALDQAVTGQPAVLEVDVAGVSYCSLAGLLVIDEARHRLGGTLVLLGVGRAVRRLLDLQQQVAAAGTVRR